jgi:amino acid transporter
VGDILGAGIYALIGKVAGLVGSACWLAFLFSFFVAVFTAFSYGELGSRFPRSAGASVYSLRAFRNPALSYFVGFLVLMSGVVSMATVSHGFAGYVRAVWPAIPTPAVILAFLLLLTAINFWGIRESSLTNIFCTALEISGILIVVWVGLRFFGSVNYLEIVPPEGKGPVTGFFQASVLAFYAFIGFEDIANVAEETRDPERVMPRAILTALGIVTVLYILTAVAAVSAVPASELAHSTAPLVLVVKRGLPWFPAGLFSLIALFAVTNTALVNFIMGSRLLYGMAKEGLLPPFLGRVHPARHTPYVAIGVVLSVAAVLAFTGTLVILAQSNSLILLSIYFLMNGSLLAVKFRREEPCPPFQVPLWVPFLGCLTAFFLAFFVDRRAFLTVGILLLAGSGLYFLLRKGGRASGLQT